MATPGQLRAPAAARARYQPGPVPFLLPRLPQRMLAVISHAVHPSTQKQGLSAHRSEGGAPCKVPPCFSGSFSCTLAPRRGTAPGGDAVGPGFPPGTCISQCTQPGWGFTTRPHPASPCSSRVAPLSWGLLGLFWDVLFLRAPETRLFSLGFPFSISQPRVGAPSTPSSLGTAGIFVFHHGRWLSATGGSIPSYFRGQK